MSKRKQGDVVPFTEYEWHFVKDHLRDNSTDTLKESLHILNMWEGRSGSSTPVVIKLTKLVLSGIVFDLEFYESNDLLTESNVKLVYGTVLVRFISYLNEICQPRRGPLKSVASATRDIGIPSWVVDMRHSIAHADLPSLSDLRNGACFCREWLWDIHWKQPVEIALTAPGDVRKTDKNESDPMAVAELKQLVADYCQVSFSKTNDPHERKAQNEKMHKTMEGFKKVVCDDPHLFVTAVAKKLLMTREQIQRAKLPYNCSENGNRIWAIPISISRFWRALIELFEECQFQITQQLCDPQVDFFDKSQLAGWTDLFMQRIFISEIVLSDYDLKLLLKNLLDGYLFIQRSNFTRLLEMLSDRISVDKKDEYMRLWDIKCNPAEGDADMTSDSDVQILTLDSLRTKKKKKTAFAEWGLLQCQSSLGLTDDQSAETLDLTLRK